jgi:Rrf2 family transcriptional regulator, nitric oxide-sensitive transcriptional repressor
MRLTQYTDYSLRVLMYLGLKQDELSTIKEISEKYKISQNHLMKVVHQLGRHGFIHTTRGRNGGIRLAAAPKEINVGDVVRKCEDDMRLVECFDAKTNTCPISNVCGLAGMVDEALSAMLAVLDKKTLADVLKKSPGVGPILGLA